MIERNGEREWKQKLPTPGSVDNGIKTDVVVVVDFKRMIKGTTIFFKCYFCYKTIISQEIFYLRCRLRIFLFCRKVLFHSQDI